LPVVGALHGEDVRPVGHQPADPPVVAGGRQAAGDDHLDQAGQLLDLLQDVRAEQDGVPAVAECVQQLHHVHPLPRVHPVERLVEQQHLRLVHQRGRHPGALPHALGEGFDAAVLRVGHLDQGECAGRRGRGVGQLLHLGAGHHELPGGEEPVDRLALGDQAEGAVDLRVAPGGRAVDGDGAAGRREEAGHHVQHCRLAGAVRAEQAGHPGLQGHADVVDRHHVAVPAGDVLQLDDAHHATSRFRRGSSQSGHSEATFR
jgi:hypothetical protein